MEVKVFGNVVITGGAGFIGCNLVKNLLNYNVKKIYILDNLSSGVKSFLPEDVRIEFIYCDISNYEKCSKSFPRVI